jgi:hypothetical protein
VPSLGVVVVVAVVVVCIGATAAAAAVMGVTEGCGTKVVAWGRVGTAEAPGEGRGRSRAWVAIVAVFDWVEE